MTAYFYKFVDGDGEDVDFVGAAFAPNLKELFWEIDQYGDPYRCKVITASSGSFCMYRPKDDEAATELSSTRVPEFCDIPYADDPRWRTPKWDVHD